MKNTLKKIKKTLLDIIFPPLCISCKENLKSKKEKKLSLCIKCENNISINVKKETIKINDLDYIHLYTTSYKNKVIRNIIHALKYNQIKPALNAIKIELIKPYIKNHINIFKKKDWIIIPIPIHSSKRRKRGFNQSKLIAKELSKILEKNNIKSSTENNFLIKEKRTKSQTKLKKKERRQNIKKAFKLNKNKNLKNKNAILVDDVFTTGSTVKEAIKVLEKYSYKNLIVFTIAKN